MGGGQAQKVPLQELDWLVCNSGADIWHATAAGGDASKVAWSADERWEDHIDFRHVVAVKLNIPQSLVMISHARCYSFSVSCLFH